MAIDEKVYTESRARSLTQMEKTKQSDSCHIHLGCIRPPLFHIELENIVLDELHLLLWIGDVLIHNLILFADSSDHRSKAHGGVVTSHIKELEVAIQSCGVQQKREANGKPIPGSYKWTVWHENINCSCWRGSLRRCRHYCHLSYVNLLLNSGRWVLWVI